MQEIRLLIVKIAKGDKEALKQFLSNYGGNITTAANRVLKDKALCEDVLNDVLLKIWENADKIKGYSNISGYIYTMSYNKAIDLKRKQKDVFFTDEQQLINITDKTETVKDEKLFIDGILEKIEEPYRSILILKASFNYNFYEIAKIKNLSYKQARNYYLKACKMFKDLYK